MRPDTSRWRSPSTYDYLDDLVAADLAWEWLRRNADYQRDYAEVKHPDADRERLTNMVRMRWGLRFPCRPNFQCQRDCSVLGAGRRSEHSNAHDDPDIGRLGKLCATSQSPQRAVRPGGVEHCARRG
ncbi:transcriptional regulator domain-containing protein [Sinorhizobium medicae]|uniref:transcriptional regulator domain-containing protein n=1 Tax=Sinorhizobium medicae TaxID=110321 RepID=UPI001F2ACBC6|nr:DUF6499 domain-containing protein [Sinorhizobium medicae]